MREGFLWPFALAVIGLSLSSFGGGPSIFAPLQHEVVEVRHWLDNREFIDLFAISRAAPGPGTILVTLIGWKLAGWTGAIIATLALFVPSSLLCYGVAHLWNRYRGHSWHVALENGLAPIGAGLIAAGVLAIGQIGATGPLFWGVAAVATAALFYRPKLNPLLLLSAGAIVFVLVRTGLGIA